MTDTAVARWRHRLEGAISYACKMPLQYDRIALRKPSGQEVQYARDVLRRGFRCALDMTARASDLREAIEALSRLDETAPGYPAMRLAREWLLEAWNA